MTTAPPKYCRSAIISWDELPEEVQKEFPEVYDKESSFVKFFNEYLPLHMFMRVTHSKIWDGMYGTSYFSAYFIKFNRSNDEALVAERFS